MYGALSLLLTFLAVAALFLLRHAEFVGIVQIFVYGGGIMVLFLFVIMLVNLHRLPEVKLFGGQTSVALVLAVGLLLFFGYFLLQVPDSPAFTNPQAFVSIQGETVGNSQAVAWHLYTRRPAALRDRLAVSADRDGRSRGFGQAALGTSWELEGDRFMFEVTTIHYLALSFVLFTIGVFGIAARKNMITVLMSIELVLNSVNLNLVAFSYQLSDLTGQVFAVFTITVAAGEAAVGLGILIALFRQRETTMLDQAAELKG